jgi:hypothetical protein
LEAIFESVAFFMLTEAETLLLLFTALLFSLPSTMLMDLLPESATVTSSAAPFLGTVDDEEEDEEEEEEAAAMVDAPRGRACTLVMSLARSA